MTEAYIGVLLPARLETRFVEKDGVDNQGQPVRHWVLKIAVIPDEPWMNHHSETVSADEARCLAELWATVRAQVLESGQPLSEARTALSTTPAGQGAFRRLAQQVGAARAWWLVTHFDLAEIIETGEKSLSHMRSFPDQVEIWLGLSGENDVVLHRLEPPLVIDQAAMAFATPDALKLFTDGHWWTEQAGLQGEYILPFTDESELASIEFILAVGLGTGSPRELFEDHRNAGRLSLLPLGAATNTVAGEPAADLGQSADAWWGLLQQPGEREAAGDLSFAVAGNATALRAIPGGTRDHRTLNQDLVRLLWPALWGHTLKDVWCVDHALNEPFFSAELGLWAQELLHPEGPLAPVRIGHQPYGIWPVTRLNRDAWRASAGDPHIERRWLAQWLPAARRRWAEGAQTVSGNIVGADTDQLVELLGRVPSGSEYGYRTFLPLQHMFVFASWLLNESGLDAEHWYHVAVEQSQVAAAKLGLSIQPIRHYMTSGWRQDVALSLVEPPPAAGPLEGIEPGWTAIVSANLDALLFFSAVTGVGQLARLSRIGTYRPVGTLSGFSSWTHVAGVSGGTLVFYNANSAETAAAWLTDQGVYQGGGLIPSFGAGWTHIIPIRQDYFFLYNQVRRAAATLRFTSTGGSYVWLNPNMSDLSEWTHIVGTRGGGLLFYDTLTGRTTVAAMSFQGVFGGSTSVPDSPAGWTHITAANWSSLFFYNAVTGEAATARLLGNGQYTFIGPVFGLKEGWTHITGTPNGVLLFYNTETGAAETARLDDNGHYSVDTGSMFAAQLARLLELGDESGAGNLFWTQPELCFPVLGSDSLLIRLIINSLALLYGELGRMKVSPHLAGLPVIETFNPENCSELKQWCLEASLQFSEVFDDGIVADRLGADVISSGMPLIQLLRDLIETLQQWRDTFDAAGHNEEALRQRLADIERAFRATLDTASVRIDPWITGMAWRRLNKLRAEGQADALGVYAWVDRPYTGSPGPTDGGTLLAPSYAQLVTALILRDKQVNDFEANRWQIELDSRKVRLAKRLADEVRGGAYIQEVLGRAVEEVLRDDATIRMARKAFPIREEHAGRRVCDGQRVLHTDSGQQFLQGLNLTSVQRAALNELFIVTDTYGDLLVANAVHAVIEGRPEKAGETMEAAAGLELPPELELLRTSHLGQSANTTVWLALPAAAQPDAGTVDASPAILADASVAAFLDQAVPAAEWAWHFEQGSDRITVTLADLGLSVPETLAYDEDGLLALAMRHAGAESEIEDAAASATTHQRLRRLAALLAGHVHDIHPADTHSAAQWAAHDSELRSRFMIMQAAAGALSQSLTADDADGAALQIARRWGISPAPLDDQLAPDDYRLTDAEQLQYQLSQAQETIQARLDRANLLDSQTPLHQIVQAIAELSGIPMPVYGRIEQAALHVYDRLRPNPALDQTWLEVTAAVRPALARLEAYQLGPDPNLDGWSNRSDPWGYEGTEADSGVKQPVNVMVCYAPVSTLREEAIPDGTLAVAVLDSWSEVIPAKEHAVETAFGFNAPSSRASQAILLAVPPDETKPLDTETLAHIVMEARQTAHARMASPNDIAPYASLFPFAMLSAQPPTGVDMKLFDPFET